MTALLPTQFFTVNEDNSVKMPLFSIQQDLLAKVHALEVENFKLVHENTSLKYNQDLLRQQVKKLEQLQQHENTQPNTDFAVSIAQQFLQFLHLDHEFLIVPKDTPRDTESKLQHEDSKAVLSTKQSKKCKIHKRKKCKRKRKATKAREEERSMEKEQKIQLLIRDMNNNLVSDHHKRTRDQFCVENKRTPQQSEKQAKHCSGKLNSNFELPPADTEESLENFLDSHFPREDVQCSKDDLPIQWCFMKNQEEISEHEKVMYHGIVDGIPFSTTVEVKRIYHDPEGTYYVIAFDNGMERQTVRENLTKIQDDDVKNINLII